MNRKYLYFFFSYSQQHNKARSENMKKVIWFLAGIIQFFLFWTCIYFVIQIIGHQIKSHLVIREIVIAIIAGIAWIVIRKIRLNFPYGLESAFLRSWYDFSNKIGAFASEKIPVLKFFGFHAHDSLRNTWDKKE